MNYGRGYRATVMGAGKFLECTRIGQAAYSGPLREATGECAAHPASNSYDVGTVMRTASLTCRHKQGVPSELALGAAPQPLHKRHFAPLAGTVRSLQSAAAVCSAGQEC